MSIFLMLKESKKALLIITLYTSSWVVLYLAVDPKVLLLLTQGRGINDQLEEPAYQHPANNALVSADVLSRPTFANKSAEIEFIIKRIEEKIILDIEYRNLVKEALEKCNNFDEVYFYYSSQPLIDKQANAFLKYEKEKRQLGDDVIFVGFHIRRTDYERHIKGFYGGEFPGTTYFKRAMTYYRHTYKEVFFIIASDDKNFAQKTFKGEKDVMVSPETWNSLQDFTILTACNHSIMTFGSYGFWASYLAGGEVVYPKINDIRFFYDFGHESYMAAQLVNFIPMESS